MDTCFSAPCSTSYPEGYCDPPASCVNGSCVMPATSGYLQTVVDNTPQYVSQNGNGFSLSFQKSSAISSFVYDLSKKQLYISSGLGPSYDAFIGYSTSDSSIVIKPGIQWNLTSDGYFQLSTDASKAIGIASSYGNELLLVPAGSQKLQFKFVT